MTGRRGMLSVRMNGGERETGLRISGAAREQRREEGVAFVAHGIRTTPTAA